MVEWPVAVCVASAVAGLVAVLVALAAARRDARSQEARAGAAELREAVARADRAEQRARELEAQREALRAAAKLYLARLGGMVGGAPLSDDDARVLLDATAVAAGAEPGPALPGSPGLDGSGPVVGGGGGHPGAA